MRKVPYPTSIVPGTSCGARRWASAEGCLRTPTTHHNCSDARPTTTTLAQAQEIPEKGPPQALGGPGGALGGTKFVGAPGARYFLLCCCDIPPYYPYPGLLRCAEHLRCTLHRFLSVKAILTPCFLQHHFSSRLKHEGLAAPEVLPTAQLHDKGNRALGPWEGPG